jgi:hypothetical protein
MSPWVTRVLFSACRFKRIRGRRRGGLQLFLSSWFSGTVKRSRKTSCVYWMDCSVSYKWDQMSLHVTSLLHGLGCWCSDWTTALVQNDTTCNSCTHLWNQLVLWMNWNYISWPTISVRLYYFLLSKTVCVQFGALSIVNVIEWCFRTRMYTSYPAGDAVQYIFYLLIFCSVFIDLYITRK